jgi:hypothetical protein
MNNIDNRVEGIAVNTIANQLCAHLDAQVRESAWSPCRDHLEDALEPLVLFGVFVATWRKLLDDNGQQH